MTGSAGAAGATGSGAAATGGGGGGGGGATGCGVGATRGGAVGNSSVRGRTAGAGRGGATAGGAAVTGGGGGSATVGGGAAVAGGGGGRATVGGGGATAAAAVGSRSSCFRRPCCERLRSSICGTTAGGRGGEGGHHKQSVGAREEGTRALVSRLAAACLPAGHYPESPKNNWRACLLQQLLVKLPHLLIRRAQRSRAGHRSRRAPRRRRRRWRSGSCGLLWPCRRRRCRRRLLRQGWRRHAWRRAAGHGRRRACCRRTAGQRGGGLALHSRLVRLAASRGGRHLQPDAAACTRETCL